MKQNQTAVGRRFDRAWAEELEKDRTLNAARETSPSKDWIAAANYFTDAYSTLEGGKAAYVPDRSQWIKAAEEIRAFCSKLVEEKRLKLQDDFTYRIVSVQKKRANPTNLLLTIDKNIATFEDMKATSHAGWQHYATSEIEKLQKLKESLAETNPCKEIPLNEVKFVPPMKSNPTLAQQETQAFLTMASEHEAAFIKIEELEAKIKRLEEAVGLWRIEAERWRTITPNALRIAAQTPRQFCIYIPHKKLYNY